MKMKIILIIIIVFSNLYFSEVVLSQNSEIEKLENELKKATNSEKIDLYNQLIELYLDIDIYEAETYAKLGLKVAETLKDNELMADYYSKLGYNQIELLNYKTAISNLEKEYKIRINVENDTDLSICLYNLGTAYSLNSNEKKAIEYFEECLIYSQKSGSKLIQEQIYFTLYELNLKKKNYSEALEYYKTYVSFTNSNISTQETVENQEVIVLRKLKITQANQIAENGILILQQDSTILQQDTAIEDANIENSELTQITNEQGLEIEELNIEKAYSLEKLKNKRLLINILIISIISIILIIILLFTIIRYKTKANKKLTEQNALILKQNEEITTQSEEIDIQKLRVEKQRDEILIKSKHISDSINYAKRIQYAALPEKLYFDTLLQKSFVFFKPRDVVSGDFYWIKQMNNKIVVLVADCTGHGIPGAFVSMLGISLINAIIQNHKDYSANEILDTLRLKIKKSLRQTDEYGSSHDGMDIALTIIDSENSKIEYSGANNQIYIIRNEQLFEYKPTKNPIGIYLKEKPFEKIIIDIQKKDEIFLFSDGFPDQTGGEKKGKFKYKRFREMILNTSKLDILQQYDYIDNQLNKWKTSEEQVDDITIMGFII